MGAFLEPALGAMSMRFVMMQYLGDRFVDVIRRLCLQQPCQYGYSEFHRIFQTG